MMKNNFFRQYMFHSVNTLDLNDQRYQSYENVRNGNNKGNLLFPMKEFLSFLKYLQSMFI